MKATTMTVSVMAHFWAAGIGGGSSASGVIAQAGRSSALSPGPARVVAVLPAIG
jgi:hypothetical protein